MVVFCDLCRDCPQRWGSWVVNQSRFIIRNLRLDVDGRSWTAHNLYLQWIWILVVVKGHAANAENNILSYCCVCDNQFSYQWIKGEPVSRVDRVSVCAVGVCWIHLHEFAHVDRAVRRTIQKVRSLWANLSCWICQINGGAHINPVRYKIEQTIIFISILKAITVKHMTRPKWIGQALIFTVCAKGVIAADISDWDRLIVFYTIKRFSVSQPKEG